MDYNYAPNTNNYGYNGYFPGGPAPYAGQPYVMNQTIQMPANVNALTEEEIKVLQNKKPSKIDINISREDQLRSMCTHKHNGTDVVQELNDGSGKVYCPICSKVWTPTGDLKKEDIEAAVELISSAMQTAKWVGDYNIELVRDYFPIDPLLSKFPDLYEHAMATYNKYLNQNGYQNAGTSHVYSMYNQLTNNYGMPMGYGNNPYIQQAAQYQYGVQQPQQQFAPYQPQQMPGMQQPMAPTQNPMQLPAGSQFGDQANNMMAGGYYGQQPQVPQYAYPQGQMPQYQYGQAPNAQQPVQPGVNEVTTQNTTADATTGEVTSETTVNLA